MKDFTVVGVWMNDRPISVGVIGGEHEVTGGDSEEFPEGLWATRVDAESVDEAERRAVTEMLASL